MDIFNAPVDYLVDLLLVVIFYLNFSVTEETQPNFTDVPNQLALRLAMVLALLGIVDIFSFLLFSALVADDMSESPHAFFANHVGVLDLTRHYEVDPEMD